MASAFAQTRCGTGVVPQLLRRSRAGRPTSPAHFFNDVRPTVLAICAAWPAAAEAFPGFEHVDLIAALAEAALHRTPAERLGPQGSGWLARSIDHPPAAARQGAALMSLVVQVLDDTDGKTALARMLSRLPSRRAYRLRTLTPHCSPAMNAAIGESLRLGREAAGPPALFPQPPTHQGRLDPRSIPAPAGRLGSAAGRTGWARATPAARCRDPPGPDGPRRITNRSGPLPRHPARDPGVHRSPDPHLAEGTGQRRRVPDSTPTDRRDRHLRRSERRGIG